MQINRLIRIILALGIALTFILTLTSLLYLTRAAFDVWQYLSDTPLWFSVSYLLGLFALALVAGYAVFRLLMPRRSATPPPAPQATPFLPPTQAEVEQRLAKAEEAGVDIGQAQAELAHLRQRKQAGRVHLSLYGEISSGKSSLIRALLPDAQAEVGARGGTTRRITEYRWTTAAGDELVLADVPGTNEVGEELDDLSRAEALRSHLVLYLTDGDLTRSQYSEFRNLMALGKPCILVLNKTDRYSQAELEILKAQLRNRIGDAPRVELVGVQAGGEREILRILPDGAEELVTRPIPPQVEELRSAVQRALDEDPATLEQLRDSAVFTLAARRIDTAETAHRQTQAETLITDYSRKAMLGAMASVTPGSDLLIQGYLGVSMVKALSDLYQVPIRKADRDRLLTLVQQRTSNSLPIMLAIAGNAFKAFPGVGTVAGGLMHAVAYGIIFQTLGRALAQSFDSRAALHPLQVAQTFKESLGENLELSARDMAEIALRLVRERTDRKAAP